MLLGIYPNDLKSYVHRKTCTQMFIAALFITAKTWQCARYPSVDVWCIQMMEYYSAKKEMTYQAMK